MTYQEILNNARTCMGPYCKSCPTCNGMACKNTIPGPGAKGIGTGFIRNYQKWQELCVNMDTICENKPVDTSYDFFGKKVVLPVFAAPVGAMQLHYGDKYDDLTYNDILVTACAAAGIAAFTGDGINPAVMEGAAEALKKNSGCGVPTVKPWNMALVEEKMALAKAADPIAIAMDIDAAGLPFLKNMTPPAGSKTVEELRQIAEKAEKPFILKGIMTVNGAKKALEAGAKGAITVAVACAMAGMIAGCITVTGLASILINTIVQAAGNAYVTEFSGTLMLHIRRIKYHYFHLPAMRQASASQHADILTALRAHDAALAKQRMREHWLRAMRGCLNETIAYLGQNEA